MYITKRKEEKKRKKYTYVYMILGSWYFLKKERKEYIKYHHLFRKLYLDDERFQLHFQRSRSQLESCFDWEL